MTRFADGPVVEVAVSIDAPVDAVWDLVSDIDLPARFQDEPNATWTFFLEVAEGGTALRFRRIIGPGPGGLTAAIERYPEREEGVIATRDEEHRTNMQAVVDGVRQLAEII